MQARDLALPLLGAVLLNQALGLYFSSMNSPPQDEVAGFSVGLMAVGVLLLLLPFFRRKGPAA